MPSTRAKRSRQLPTAMSSVSPKMRYRCSEYAMTCAAVGWEAAVKHARLGVAARDIQHGGVAGAGDQPPHLYVPDTVVHAHQRLAPHQRARARDDCHHVQRRAHPRALGEADAVNVGRRHLRLRQRLGQHCSASAREQQIGAQYYFGMHFFICGVCSRRHLAARSGGGGAPCRAAGSPRPAA